MDHKDFIQHYTVYDDHSFNIELLSVLDDLYLRFTKEQLMQMISDFYDNADQIYNSLHRLN